MNKKKSQLVEMCVCVGVGKQEKRCLEQGEESESEESIGGKEGVQLKAGFNGNPTRPKHGLTCTLFCFLFFLTPTHVLDTPFAHSFRVRPPITYLSPSLNPTSFKCHTPMNLTLIRMKLAYGSELINYKAIKIQGQWSKSHDDVISLKLYTQVRPIACFQSPTFPLIGMMISCKPHEGIRTKLAWMELAGEPVIWEILQNTPFKTVYFFCLLLFFFLECKPFHTH